MIFSIDIWHKEWGIGFSIIIWERLDFLKMLLGFEGQIKGFGKQKACSYYWEKELNESN